MHVHAAGFYGAPRGGVSQSTLFLLEAYALGAADGVRLGLAVLLAVYGLAQLRPVPAEPGQPGRRTGEDVASPASLRRPASSSPAAIQCGLLSARGLA